MDDGQQGRINSFALVSYLPEPLRGFLDNLRSDLVPGCHTRAHVTLLPPRPLSGPADEAWEEMRRVLEHVEPFPIVLGSIAMFAKTQVIYIELERGATELIQLHQALNAGQARFVEPFEYHPHITLAQELKDPALVGMAREIAEQRWSRFAGLREFEVNRLTFVQNSVANLWSDLQQIDLRELARGVRDHFQR